MKLTTKPQKIILNFSENTIARFTRIRRFFQRRSTALRLGNLRLLERRWKKRREYHKFA